MSTAHPFNTLPLAADDPATLPPRCFFLSFNHGYREMAETIAPILGRKGIPATFFLCSSLMDNRSWLFEDQVGLITHRLSSQSDENISREVNRILDRHGNTMQSLASCRIPATAVIEDLTEPLAIDWSEELSTYQPDLSENQVDSLIEQGFSIGAHSIDHSLFERLHDGERLLQYRESLDTIVTRFELPYRVFAFPYGEFGIPPREPRAAQPFGFRRRYFRNPQPHRGRTASLPASATLVGGSSRDFPAIPWRAVDSENGAPLAREGSGGETVIQ